MTMPIQDGGDRKKPGKIKRPGGSCGFPELRETVSDIGKGGGGQLIGDESDSSNDDAALGDKSDRATDR